MKHGIPYDNWGNYKYGHALFLAIPEAIYLNNVHQRETLQSQIREDINKIHNIQGEYISEIFLELQLDEDHDWQKESGLFLEGQRNIAPDSANRVWGEEMYYRVFLSHKNEVKKKTAALKENLKLFGISAFVAHKDIHPTKKWQDEIENALFSMDAFVAILTEDFHNSDWTDQEVGVAFGRGIPIISIKLGQNPYGFIGKFQALSCSWDIAPKEIVKILIQYPKMIDAFIKAVSNCGRYDDGNTLSEMLPFIKNISDQQIINLLSAVNENGQARDSFGFSGESSKYGDGLVPHLNRWTGKTYNRNSQSGVISVKS